MNQCCFSSSPRHVDLSNLPTQEKGKEAFTWKGSTNQTALQRSAGTAQEQVKKCLQLMLSSSMSAQWRTAARCHVSASPECRRANSYNAYSPEWAYSYFVFHCHFPSLSYLSISVHIKTSCRVQLSSSRHICGPISRTLDPPSCITSWHSLNQTPHFPPQAGAALQEAGRAWSAEALSLGQLILQLLLWGLPWWRPAAFFAAGRRRPVAEQPALQQQDQGPYRRPHEVLHAVAWGP